MCKMLLNNRGYINVNQMKMVKAVFETGKLRTLQTYGGLRAF